MEEIIFKWFSWHVIRAIGTEAVFFHRKKLKLTFIPKVSFLHTF